MITALAVLFIILVIVSKTVLFRIVCAQKELATKRKNTATWSISLFVGLAPLIVLIPMAYLGSMFAGLGAPGPTHHTFLSIILSLVIIFPVYITPITTLISVALGFGFLKLAKTNKRWYMLFAGYLASLVAEYLLIGLFYVTAKP